MILGLAGVTSSNFPHDLLLDKHANLGTVFVGPAAQKFTRAKTYKIRRDFGQF